MCFNLESSVASFKPDFVWSEMGRTVSGSSGFDTAPNGKTLQLAQGSSLASFKPHAHSAIVLHALTLSLTACVTCSLESKALE